MHLKCDENKDVLICTAAVVKQFTPGMLFSYETGQLFILQQAPARLPKTIPKLKTVNKDEDNRLILLGLFILATDERMVKSIMEGFFLHELKVKTKVVTYERIRDDMFIIEIDNLAHKLAILANRYRLIKKKSSIHVFSKTSERDETIQRKIELCAHKEREKGNYVQVTDRKLSVNGQAWWWSDKINGVKKVIIDIYVSVKLSGLRQVLTIRFV